MKIASIILAVVFLAAFTKTASADFWIYCQDTSSAVCWVATPVVTPVVTPDPVGPPTNSPAPLACPGGGVASNGCKPIPGSATAVGNVYVRTGPGMDYQAFNVLSLGATVSVTGPEVDGWTPVLVDGRNGYVRSTWLTS